MNPKEEKLLKALRELAADAPQGASPELAITLQGAFRRHHRRRRVMRIGGSVLACLAMALALLVVRRPESQAPAPLAVGPRPAAAPPARGASMRRLPPVRRSTQPKAQVRRGKPQTARGQARPAQTLASDFVALPSFDPALPIEQSQMVRLVLPGSALRLVGYPVNEDLAERRVVTDVLVSQDGTPYAVRLVSTQAVHP
jgi:hypothetical protein